MTDLRTVQIRKLDFDVWQEIRVEASRRRVPVAQLLIEVWRAYKLLSGDPESAGQA